MTEPTSFTAYVTKYALTKGIQTFAVEIRDRNPNMAITLHPDVLQYFYFPDWHRTHEAAVAQAEKMRVAKIVTVKKQLAKLEKMKFE